MRGRQKELVEWSARFALWLCGLILAIGTINALILTMPQHRIVFIILAFVFLISAVITWFADLKKHKFPRKQ